MRGNRGRPGLLPVGVGNGVIIPPMDRAGNQIRNDQNAAAPIPIIAAKRAIPTDTLPWIGWALPIVTQELTSTGGSVPVPNLK